METVFSNYRDYNYINALIFNNLYRLPSDIDAVVGIPRSGMITAAIIAEFRSLPLTDLFSFIQGNSIKPSLSTTKVHSPKCSITVL